MSEEVDGVSSYVCQRTCRNWKVHNSAINDKSIYISHYHYIKYVYIYMHVQHPYIYMLLCVYIYNDIILCVHVGIKA